MRSCGSTNVMFTLLSPIAYSTSYVLLVLATKFIFLISLLVLASHHSWLGKICCSLHASLEHVGKGWLCIKMRTYYFPRKQQTFSWRWYGYDKGTAGLEILSMLHFFPFLLNTTSALQLDCYRLSQTEIELVDAYLS